MASEPILRVPTCLPPFRASGTSRRGPADAPLPAASSCGDGPRARTRGARAVVLVALSFLLSVLAGCSGLGHFPPFHEVEGDLPGGVVEERRAFGLHEIRRWPDGSEETILRPFSATLRLPPEPGKVPTTRWTVLPPFAYGSQTPDQVRSTVWPFWFDTSAGTPAERAARTSDDDTWLFPFLAFGHEPGQEDAFAVIPLGGRLRQKLFADRIDFALFPLWVRTEAKDEEETWTSWHVLWPLVASGESRDADDPSRTGPRGTHFRVLPFWSQTDTATRHSRSALWPIVHWGTETRESRTTDGWFVFPFGGRRTSRDGTFEETSVLWPFFTWSDDTRTGDRVRALPFPFYRETIRPGVSTTRWYWPLHGTFRSEEESSDFWLWPFVWTGTTTRDGRVSTRRFVVPFWMERSAGPAGGAPDLDELRAWPLFSREDAPGGLRTIRVPEIVPFFGWRSGESVYADLLSLWRYRSDASGRAAWDLPFGFVRWRRGSDGSSRLTLFWWLDVPTGGGR